MHARPPSAVADWWTDWLTLLRALASFKDAVATVRRTTAEHQFQLVITRAYEEGEAELLDGDAESELLPNPFNLNPDRGLTRPLALSSRGREVLSDRSCTQLPVVDVREVPVLRVEGHRVRG